MHSIQHSVLPFALLASAFASSASSQAQPVEAHWSDNWNSAHHRFTDLDGDGTFNGPGEVAFHVDPASPASYPARALQVTEENGQVVSYWLDENDDLILRGVDLNGDGTLSGAEIKTFRDSGALDGNSWPQALDVTDDGAVWWSSGLLLAMPQNGLSRLEDLNGDGDAADAGEQVLMVNGNGTHFVQHDLGSTAISTWYLNNLVAAGNAVVAFSSYDVAAYRFEDTNADGDVLDAGESILLLNASGELPGLPMNPDFANGTLRSLQSQAGYPASFRYMATTLENGERVFYFGTDGSPFTSTGTNLAGEGINFLIFRGIDGNGDGDINDAGEVKLFFNGSHTDGSPNLLILRGLDVLDGGTLYAVGVKPYPVLAPGPNGDTWIHRFEDLDGDGSAMGLGEQQLNIFDLQVSLDSTLFPMPPDYGNIMADPWAFSVRRLTAWTDIGGASAGIHGEPTLTGTGSLAAGSTATVSVSHAPGGALMLSWLSLAAHPKAIFGGTLYAFPTLFLHLAWVADMNGNLTITEPWPAGLPAGTDIWLQFIVKDVTAASGITLSNALKLTTP